jgi:hypothetical protein
MKDKIINWVYVFWYLSTIIICIFFIIYILIAFNQKDVKEEFILKENVHYRLDQLGYDTLWMKYTTRTEMNYSVDKPEEYNNTK